MIPKDPFILLSYLNTQLRDYYPSLEELCASLNILQGEIEEKLNRIDFVYDKNTNQFV